MSVCRRRSICTDCAAPSRRHTAQPALASHLSLTHADGSGGHGRGYSVSPPPPLNAAARAKPSPPTHTNRRTLKKALKRGDAVSSICKNRMCLLRSRLNRPESEDKFAKLLPPALHHRSTSPPSAVRSEWRARASDSPIPTWTSTCTPSMSRVRPPTRPVLHRRSPVVSKSGWPCITAEATQLDGE
jgi:hypothetical protein